MAKKFFITVSTILMLTQLSLQHVDALFSNKASNSQIISQSNLLCEDETIEAFDAIISIKIVKLT